MPKTAAGSKAHTHCPQDETQKGMRRKIVAEIQINRDMISDPQDEEELKNRMRSI